MNNRFSAGSPFCFCFLEWIEVVSIFELPSIAEITDLEKFPCKNQNNKGFTVFVVPTAVPIIRKRQFW